MRKNIRGQCIRTQLVTAALAFATSAQASTVDDAAVRKWIVAALKSEQQYAGSVSDASTIAKRLDEPTVGDAWSKLQACRNDGNSLDLNLAAAEHYLFARDIASNEGDLSFKELPRQYAAWKTWLQGKGLEQILKTSSEPVSPVDPKVTKWGQAGIDAGLSDYASREGKAPSSKASSWQIKFGVLYGIGYRYLPERRPCIVSIR